MARRVRGRRGGDWLDGIWALASSPAVPAIALTIAGAILTTAAWSGAPEATTSTWWTAPTQSPDALRSATALLLACAPLALIALLSRRRDVSARAEVDIDLLVGGDAAEDALDQERLAWAPRLGLGLMVAGAAVSIGAFLSIQSGSPSTLSSLPVGKTIEFVEGAVLGKPVRLMLPRRVKATRLEMGERGALMGISFSTPGEDPTEEQQLTVGESVVLDGLRLTFVGTREDSTMLRAVISGTSEQTIQVGAGEGESFKVTPEGPEYTIRQMTLNHLGVMGPAVQVEDPDGDARWIFMRQPSEDLGPAYDAPLRLDRFETRRAPVIAVAPARPSWPPMAAGGIFVAGLGMLLMFVEITRRGGRTGGFASLNGAGFIAASFGPYAGSPTTSADEEE